MDMGECPGNTIGVKAIGYPGILVNITRVVVVNEVILECLPKHGPCKHYKTDANADKFPVVACLGKND
ncbi:MAG: hypothetical protein DME20_00240 [Verrucomicrobia bacterium]|nr:MAG: hypothetical protein DME71_07575 [Verrucomicrobiota bacterium]PYK51979.1 MAG: hypothetical protein DME20_00240 [Verrucomicrobiota bacterium]